MRFFLEISYLGTAYHGWQKQPNAPAIQEILEDRMGKLLGNGPIDLVGAGRTDAGVHARQLFAHFDRDAALPSGFVHRLNAFLPADIAVKGVYEVAPNAHARFDATGRTYEYHLVREKDPFREGLAYQFQGELDFGAMNRAAASMLGYGNFKAFSRSKSDVKTYNCDLREARWEEGDGVWVFTISADRFLRNMVRAVVGTLLEVGKGRLDAEGVKTIIKSQDRSEAGVSVPAKGLYLTRITYPDTLFLHDQRNR